MKNLLKLVDATKKLSSEKFIERLIIDSANEHNKELIELIKGQIRVGVKGDGSRTLKYTDDGSRFNPNYYVAKVKKTTAKQMPFRNYENEGDFLGDMFAFARDISIFVGSQDEKTPFIEGEEGSELFELTEENKDEFAKFWVPTFIKKIRDEFKK
jgi:hypothetical protein